MLEDFDILDPNTFTDLRLYPLFFARHFNLFILLYAFDFVFLSKGNIIRFWMTFFFSPRYHEEMYSYIRKIARLRPAAIAI